MKKYKLVNGEGWISFEEGQTYDGNFESELGGTVEFHATNGVNRADWEEVVEEDKPIKNFKFVGTQEEADKYIYPVRVGDVYSDDYFKNKDSMIYLISEFTSYESIQWEEVAEQFVNKPKIFTDAEVVTLVTFLNDNFEEFKKCLFSDISRETWVELDGGAFNEANLLIDKLEKNDTPLTEAEKVTLITFLNDNFEDFDNFINGELWFIYYWDLNGNGGEEASLLIDKIELS